MAEGEPPLGHSPSWAWAICSMSMIQPGCDLLVTQQALVALGRSLHVSTQMQTPVVSALPTLYTGSTTLITGSAMPQPST